MKRTLLAFALLAACAAVRADVLPGKWELSAVTNVEGIAGTIGPIVQTRCFTAADARDPARVLGPAASAGCEYSNRRDNGSEMSFDVSCSGQVPVQGRASVRYAGDSMDGDVSLSGSASGRAFSTHTHLHGRRLGGC